MAWTFYNASGEALTNFGPVVLTDLDIDGATALSGAVADADLFIVDDNASGTNRKVTAAVIKTYIAAPTEATQAILEEDTPGSSTANTYISPEVAHFHPAVAKAWANINADGDTLSQDFGCASVSRISTGKYRTVVVAMAASNVFFGATNSVAGDDIVTFNMSANTQLDSYVLRAGSVSNIGHCVITFGAFA